MRYLSDNIATVNVVKGIADNEIGEILAGELIASPDLLLNMPERRRLWGRSYLPNLAQPSEVKLVNDGSLMSRKAI